MEDTSVVMKRAIGVLLISFSISGCSSSPYYADKSVNTFDSYQPATSVVSLVYNLGMASAYSVPAEARDEHENCVFMMLDNGNPGDACNWHTDRASGTVRVAMIRPNMCHDLISTVNYRNKTDSWQEQACPQGNTWKFYR